MERMDFLPRVVLSGSYYLSTPTVGNTDREFISELDAMVPRRVHQTKSSTIKSSEMGFGSRPLPNGVLRRSRVRVHAHDCAIAPASRRVLAARHNQPPVWRC